MCYGLSHDDVDIAIIDVNWFGRVQIDDHTALVHVDISRRRTHVDYHATLVHINGRVHIDDDATLINVDLRVHVYVHCALV